MRSARRAGASGIRRRRVRAKRSTAAARNGQRHRREDELDRPAAEDPVTEVEVAGRRRPGLDALVEREQELLRGAAQLSEPLAVQRLARVERRVAALLGGRRQRHGGDAARDERRLLGERVRERERAELLDHALSYRRLARFLQDPFGGGAHEHRRGGERTVAVDGEPRPGVAAERVERDDGRDPVAVRGILRQVGGADRAVGAAVGGDEQERVRRAHAACRGAGRGRLCVRARELDERGGAGGVVDHAAAEADLVAMREHDDHARRAARDAHDHVRQRALAEPGHLGLEPLSLRPEAVEPELLVDPVHRAEIAGAPLARLLDEILGEELRRRGVEGGGERRRRQRLGLRDAEGRDEQGQADQEPGAPVHAAVHGPLERAAPCPAAALESRRSGHIQGYSRPGAGRSGVARPRPWPNPRRFSSSTTRTRCRSSSRIRSSATATA